MVDLIKHSADELHLVGSLLGVSDVFLLYFSVCLVIAAAADEMHSDIHSGEESSGSSNDYSERRSLAITVPDYSLVEIHDEKFYVRFVFRSFKIEPSFFLRLGFQHSHRW